MAPQTSVLYQICDAETQKPSRDEMCKELQVLNLRGVGTGTHLEMEKREAKPTLAASWAMDIRVWERLPGDILDRILLRLPAASHFQFRAVCKSWLLELGSPAFLRRWAAMAPAPLPLFTLPRPRSSLWRCGEFSRKQRQSWVPEAARCELRRLDLSFLPGKMVDICHVQHGLVCARIASPGAVALAVCNPVTKTFRKLPEVPVQEGRAWVAALVDAPKPDSFRVALLTEDHTFWTIRLFCSQAGSWKETRTQSYCPIQFLGSTLLQGGLLYASLSHGPLLLYSLESGRMLARAPMPPAMSSDYFQLVQSRGDVFLVGQLEGDIDVVLTLGIWKLEPSRLVWEDFSFLPESQWQDVKLQVAEDWSLDDSTEVDMLDADAIGDFIFVGVEAHNNVAAIGSNYRTQALAFHIRSKSWHLFYKRYLVGEPPYLLEPRFDLFL